VASVLRIGGMAVTTEEFFAIWSNWVLRQYLLDTARALSKDDDVQEECLQEAWARIGLLSPDATEEFCRLEGKRAMWAFLYRERAYRKKKRLLRDKYNMSHKSS
jgi:hypothetical protein